MSLVKRLRRWIVGLAAAFLVVFATTGCVTKMSNIGNPHTDPIDALLVCAVVLPPALVATLVTCGPCELSDDPDHCICRAASGAMVPGMVLVKLIGTVTSPSIWWTALKGEDWIGENPWGLDGPTCEPTPPEEPAAPPTGPPQTTPPSEAPPPDPAAPPRTGTSPGPS